MNLALLSATARTAAFEVVDAAGPDLDAPLAVFLNGKPVLETTAAVFVLNELSPDTGYSIRAAGGASLAFCTRAETAALDVRLFGAVGDGMPTTGRRCRRPSPPVRPAARSSSAPASG